MIISDMCVMLYDHHRHVRGGVISLPGMCMMACDHSNACVGWCGVIIGICVMLCDHHHRVGHGVYGQV